MEFGGALQHRRRRRIRAFSTASTQERQKLGLVLHDPASFTTEQFRDAVHAQLVTCPHLLGMQNLLELLHQRYLPNPWPRWSSSIAWKGSHARRARYNTGPGMNGNGVADYADSMVAVKLVFDEKVDMATLADAVARLQGLRTPAAPH